MNKKKYAEFKKMKAGDEFPDDFWNYKINPITGFYVKPYTGEEMNKTEVNKYAQHFREMKINTA